MNASLTSSSQNSTNNTSTKKRKTLNNNVFHIRLGNHINVLFLSKNRK